jgi:hypothetical protein
MTVFTYTNPGLNVNDIYVILFRDYESQAYAFVKALTNDAEFTFETYFDLDATENAAVSSTNYTMAKQGQQQKIDLPESGAFQNRLTRILVTKGRIAIEVTSPTIARTYLEQPESPPRIA